MYDSVVVDFFPLLFLLFFPSLSNFFKSLIRLATILSLFFFSLSYSSITSGTFVPAFRQVHPAMIFFVPII